MSTSRARALVAVALTAALLAACSDDGDTASTTTKADTPAADGSLVDVCPAKVVIQTDWYATPERAAAYQLVGPDGTIDADKGTYSGPLGDTGIDVEVRLGGPFIGFTPPGQQMYTDDSIYLAYVATDEAVQAAEKFPTTAVVAPLDINPQILMWDPATYDITTWPDVAKTGATITYLEGLPFMDYLLSKGYVKQSQLDSSFDGTPSRFVAENGKIIQQGYASNEPYRWEHDVEGWKKPVKSLLVHDSGYEIYPQGLSVRSDDLAKDSPCLEKLVPLIQQAQVDYAATPGPTNAALVKIADAIGDGPPITAAANADAVKVMLDLKLIGNGPDDTLGNFDLDRVDRTIELLRPIFAARDTAVPADLAAKDIVTNEFIDPSIHQ
jgi:hypothetical protein